MNPKLNTRTLRAVVAARTRMRDAAAAAEAAADLVHTRAVATSQGARADLDQTLDDTRERMPLAASVLDVERMADEITGDRVVHLEAERRREQAAASLGRAKAELRLQARQLRSMERALDNQLDAHDAAQLRDEQRLSDDLGSRPRRP